MKIMTEGTVSLTLSIEEYLIVLALVNSRNARDIARKSACPVEEPVGTEGRVECPVVSSAEAREIVERFDDYGGLWSSIRAAGEDQIHRKPQGILLLGNVR